MLNAATPRFAGNGLSYYWQGNLTYFGGNSQEIGQKLVDENYRSVNYRYDESEEPHDFVSTPIAKQLGPVDYIKACHCYMYQACETPDWEDTEAYAIVNALLKRSITNLPGYDDAAWEIS